MKKPIFCFVIWIVLSLSAQCQGKTLNIDPIFQQTAEWCWVTCGEMIFRYYDVCPINPADYQCGIIALLAPQCNQNCFSCVVGAGTTEVVRNMLYAYPSYAHNICGSSKMHVFCQNVYGQVTSSALVSNIDNDMPLIAGISPAGGGSATDAAHDVLIIGYSNEEDGLALIINDPFPYAAFNMADPYTYYHGDNLGQGQYKIKFGTFRNYFAWNRTLSNIQ